MTSKKVELHYIDRQPEFALVDFGPTIEFLDLVWVISWRQLYSCRTIFSGRRSSTLARKFSLCPDALVVKFIPTLPSMPHFVSAYV